MKSLNLNLLVGALALAIVVPAIADENSLAFHLSCYPVSSDCVEMQFESEPGKTVAVKKDPEMVVTQSDLDEAEMVTGEYGQEQLQLRLKKDSAEKFGQITGNNIGKQLVVVANGKALIAPNIQQAITGGSLAITAGIGSGNKYLDGIPWLKKMSEDKKVSEQRWSMFSVISYLLLGALVLGGAIYFAFFRKKSSGESV